jgi:hypothetical protein
MGSPARLYQKEMHENLGYFASWLPADPIEIGEVGVFEGGRFRRLNSLGQLAVAFRIARGTSSQDAQYTSREGTRMTASAGAELESVAKAEVTIEFSREGAFVFQCSALRQDRIDDLAAVTARVVEEYNRGSWKKEWLFVEALHVARAATIIVSEDSSSSITLAANVDAPLATTALADPRLQLSVRSTRGRIMHVIAGKGLRPLYSCLRLVDPLFGSASVQPVRGGGVEAGALGRPGIDELLAS